MSAVATLKQRMTNTIKAALLAEDIVGPGWGFEVHEPIPNLLKIKVTAPNKVIRYHFEVRTSQKAS